MAGRAAWMLLLMGLLACGGGHKSKSAGTGVSTSGDAGEGSANACVDMDQDGFGVNCDMGTDCDDTDPSITDQCVRCAMPAKGCPCTPGTMPMRCDPHYSMRTTMNGKTGTLVCSEGSRYCRDSLYSDCEVLLQYATFMAD